MTTTAKFKKLDIADRNAVLQELDVSDDRAATELGITVEEVTTARQEVPASSNFKVDDFQKYFAKPTQSMRPKQSIVDSGSTKSLSKPVGSAAKTKPTPTKIPGKRGPRGTRIIDAFKKVTSTPVPLEEFAKANHVSVACLSQPKRFCVRTDVVVRVRKIDSVPHIWAEPVVDDATTTTTPASNTTPATDTDTSA